MEAPGLPPTQGPVLPADRLSCRSRWCTARPTFPGARRILSVAPHLLYMCRQTSERDQEAFMITGIAVAVGAVLLCTCSYVVIRKRGKARG
ncbi:hypothetical protein GCM10009551_093780 [Nocardiopsis tropica]